MLVPSNALFARLNLLLSERVKRQTIVVYLPCPGKNRGSPAYNYDRFTPKDFRVLPRCGLCNRNRQLYFIERVHFSVFYSLSCCGVSGY